MITLQVKRRIEGGLDAHRNPIITWSDPADWKVYGVAPTTAMETTADNRDRSVVVPMVYAPLSADVPTEYDRVVYNGQDYEVDGRPRDWTQGPLNPSAGVSVVLKRVEG